MKNNFFLRVRTTEESSRACCLRVREGDTHDTEEEGGVYVHCTNQSIYPQPTCTCTFTCNTNCSTIDYVIHVHVQYTYSIYMFLHAYMYLPSLCLPPHHTTPAQPPPPPPDVLYEGRLIIYSEHYMDSMCMHVLTGVICMQLSLH